MTIDEHFLYMMILESFIFFVGVLTMWYQSHKTNKMLNQILFEPEYAAAVGKNLFWGILEDVRDDQEKQAILINFGAFFAANIRQTVMGAAGDQLVKMTKGGKLKPADGLANVLNQGIGNLLSNIMQGTGKGAEKVAEKAVEGW